MIAGIPMVVRVARRVAEAQTIDAILVATDDPRIATVVRDAGFEALLTSGDCVSGTDRVARALEARPVASTSVVVNVQGDEPLIDPHDIDALVACAARRPDGVSTLARAMAPDEDPNEPDRVKVVTTATGRALYFSRAPIPHQGPWKVHVGVYAFTPPVLRRFVDATPTPLEHAERLEQLRTLELGIPIYVTMCRSKRPAIGVDVPADVGRVEAALLAFASDRGTT